MSLGVIAQAVEKMPKINSNLLNRVIVWNTKPTSEDLQHHFDKLDLLNVEEKQINKLNISQIKWANISSPRDAVIDDNDYLVAIEQSTKHFDRFDPTNLTRLANIQLSNSSLIMAVAFSRNAYYISYMNGIITVIDSQTLIIISNISTNIFGIPTNYYGIWNESFVCRILGKHNEGDSVSVTLDKCNWFLPNSAVFGIKIMKNYLMYITESNKNRIRRFQPNIQC
ncbi:hypothetical protein I4U23_017107 [Adineta vaga]|nr:hypothetical protein I4U23_017107 [Adineta vaga]